MTKYEQREAKKIKQIKKLATELDKMQEGEMKGMKKKQKRSKIMTGEKVWKKASPKTEWKTPKDAPKPLTPKKK